MVTMVAGSISTTIAMRDSMSDVSDRLSLRCTACLHAFVRTALDLLALVHAWAANNSVIVAAHACLGILKGLVAIALLAARLATNGRCAEAPSWQERIVSHSTIGIDDESINLGYSLCAFAGDCKSLRNGSCLKRFVSPTTSGKKSDHNKMASEEHVVFAHPAPLDGHLSGFADV